MKILKKILHLYKQWNITDRPSPQLKFKVSMAIDQAFRLVTNEAFSTPYRLDWVNLGMEALQLQLHARTNFYRDDDDNSGIVPNGNTLSGNGSSNNGETRAASRLIPLQRPYDAIPKGTWLKALRALTSNDIPPPRCSPSVGTFSTEDGAVQWISPPDAAFRILQRLVTGTGVRTFYKKKKFPKQQEQQGREGHTQKQQHRQQQQRQQQKQPISLDERDFNMVLHAYATRSTEPDHMHSAHRVIALQERTPHAPPLSPVAYSILVKAYGRWKDVENVEMSLLHAQRNGVVPDVVMANTVLDAYVNCGMLDRAQGVFRTMTENNGRMEEEGVGEDGGYWPLIQPNARTYNTLLKGMAEEGDVRSAVKLSKVVRRKGLWDDVTTNTLIKAAVTAGDFDAAETLLANHTASPDAISQRRWKGRNHPEVNAETRQRRGDHPNVEAYTELLDGYAKDGDLESALRVMQQMQRRGVMPNEYTYTCMVGALARRDKVRQARKMINYAATSLPCAGEGWSRTVLTPTYNAFISGLLADNKNGYANNADVSLGQSSHAAHMVEVLAVLREMQEYDIRPNVVTVALVVDGLGRCNPPRCREARELVQHLQSRSKIKQSDANYGNYNNRGGVGEGNDARGISLSNNKIATALITSYGRANDVKSATEAFDHIPEPDVVAFNALLDACCRCDELKLALELFRWRVGIAAPSSKREGDDVGKEKATRRRTTPMITSIEPDVVTYTSLISALLQLDSRAATERARSLYGEMKRKWLISPDTVLVDTILTAMIGGRPVGLDHEDVEFVLSVLRDGAHLEWEDGQYEHRKRAVRSVLTGRPGDTWKNNEFASRLMNERQPEDPLFAKKGWNSIDSGFQLWGGSKGNGDAAYDRTAEGEDDESSVDSFLASKGWNDIDSGFRLL